MYFQQGEGPSRGLLRDCENSKDLRFHFTTSPTLMVVRDQGCGGQLERVRRYCVLVMSLPGPGLY